MNRVGIAEPLAAPAVDRGDGVTVADESPDDVRADEAVAAEDQGVTVVGRRRRVNWIHRLDGIDRLNLRDWGRRMGARGFG